MFWYIIRIDTRLHDTCMRFVLPNSVMSLDNAGVDASCRFKKQALYPLLNSDTDGSNVIVLNAVNETICNMQCAVGWYHLVYGNAAPFLCAPKTTDRTSREGIPTYPIDCTSA